MKPAVKIPKLQARHPSRGVALVAVLWMVAALSIMVLGLAHVLKGEAQMARQQQRAALETGPADAAIRLVLTELSHSGQRMISMTQVREMEFMGRIFLAEIIPLNGWINLNQAPLSLLADLLVHGGGLSPQQAQLWAQAIVDYRQRPAASGQNSHFHAVEELLQIPEFPWDAYLAIQPLLTVDLDNSVQLPNPLAAPEGVLKVLAQGRQDVVDKILAARNTPEAALADTTSLTAGLYRIAPSARVEIRVTVSSGDNTAMVRAWRVALNAPAYGLPWRVLDIRPTLQLTAPNSN
jgi:general secretion pathway protein K